MITQVDGPAEGRHGKNRRTAKTHGIQAEEGADRAKTRNQNLYEYVQLVGQGRRKRPKRGERPRAKKHEKQNKQKVTKCRTEPCCFGMRPFYRVARCPKRSLAKTGTVLVPGSGRRVLGHAQPENGRHSRVMCE